MNSEKSKTSDSHRLFRLLLNLTDKMNLLMNDRYVAI